jgi:hypothetical protein
MPFHGLLDWRLGCDLVDLIRERTLDVQKRWQQRAGVLVRSFAEQFAFEFHEVAGYPVAIDEEICLIGVHPLAETDESRWSEELAEVVYEAQDLLAGRGHDADAAKIEFQDYFNLLRRPGWSYGELFSPQNAGVPSS